MPVTMLRCDACGGEFVDSRIDLVRGDEARCPKCGVRNEFTPEFAESVRRGSAEIDTNARVVHSEKELKRVGADMPKIAEAVPTSHESRERSRYLARFRATDRAAAVNIAAMDEPTAASELDRSHPHAQVSAETIGQLGAQFAHDFNNVLAVVLTSVEMAMRVGDSAKANVFLANALKVIARGRTLTDRLAAASYACEITSQVDAHAIIARLVAETGAAVPRNLRVVSALDAERSVVGVDARFFEQALRNVIANAIEAIDGAGTLTIATRNAGGAELRGEAGRDYLVVEVHDTGRGMVDEIRYQAFDLFFSTAGTDRQRGIGLAQTKDAVRRAGGIASIESAAGQGTRVTIAIPVADS